MKRIKQAICLAAVLLCATTIASAQGLDIEAMEKWINAKVVHYHIEGVHQGWTAVSEDEASQGNVTDHLVLDLNYDLQEHKMVGQPKFQNSKSTTKGTRNLNPPCPAPVLKGEYEHFEAKEVTVPEGDARVVVKGTRSYPAADIGSQCPMSTALKPSPAKEVSIEESFEIPHPATLFTPAGSTSSDITLSADKKSYTLKRPGWAWTFTPTIVQ